MKKGILLINVGTPDAPKPKEVGAYLREFLMDPRILDIPAVFRFFLVHFAIIPKRARTSATLYQKVWTERGSPLLFHTADLKEKLSALLESHFPREYLVAFGMRYGNPSIQKGIEELIRQGAREIIAVPLFPQYAEATTGTAMTEVVRALKDRLPLRWVPEFFAHPSFVSTHAALVEKKIREWKPNFILFTYHGLPERQIRKQPGCGEHCLTGVSGYAEFDCCATLKTPARCYRAQCFETTRLLSARLDILPETCATTFQSRLGRIPWIRPYTDEVLQTLAKKGFKKLMVLAPAFVSDCLETLEEISVEGRDLFLKSGGEDFLAMPCLNAEEPWVLALAQIIQGPLAMTKP